MAEAARVGSLKMKKHSAILMLGLQVIIASDAKSRVK
jgi:hypothetical protein